MKQADSRETILVLHPIQQGPWPERAEMDSVYRFARARRWNIKEFNTPKSKSSLQTLIKTWKPTGCLVVADQTSTVFKARLFETLPSVFLDVNEKLFRHGIFHVSCDPESVASTAARHLLSLGLENFAFIGYGKRWPWSAARLSAFRACLAPHRTIPAFIFPSQTQTCSPQMRARFERWLKNLPRPCGIMLANDYLSQELYPACERLGMSIPHDFAVVGVDDIESLCSNLKPALSSIRLDMAKAGWTIAKLLHDQLTNPSLHPQSLTYGALGIIPRDSTTLLSHPTDWSVEMLKKRISEMALQNITVPDLIRGLNGSRRKLETRYRAATGKSIKQTVVELRIEKACNLLRNSSMTIGAVAHFCGYKDGVQLKLAFKRQTGLTMRDWRKRFANKA